jgi:hypothetical protein
MGKETQSLHFKKKKRWKGPYMVILVTPTALKVDGIGPWVHHSHVRQASQQKQEEAKE